MKNTWHLYADSLINFLTGNSLIQDENLAATAIKVLHDRILTHRKVTKVIYIRNIPFIYTGNFLDNLRNHVHSLRRNCEFSFQFLDQETKSDPENKIFRNNQEHASSEYEKYADIYNQLSETEKRNGLRIKSGFMSMVFKKSDVVEKHNKWESFNIVEDYMLGGRYIKHVNLYIHITCDKKAALTSVLRSLKKIFKDEKIEYIVMRTKVNQYLARCSPANSFYPMKAHTKLLLSSDNIVQILPIRQEGIVTSEGFILAQNMKSNTPFLFHPCKSSSAQVNLVIGNSNAGKTFLVHGMNLGTASFNVHNIIIDYKGVEYIEMANFTKTEIISCDKHNPRLVNLFRLDNIEFKDKLEALNTYESNIDYITQSLLIIANKVSSTNVEKLRGVIRSAIVSYYNTIGVHKHNIETFKLSKEMSYNDCLDFITMANKNESLPVKIKEELEECAYTLAQEIGTNPIFLKMKENELTVGDILHSPNVIFCLNKNVEEMNTMLEDLIIYMITVLTVRKSMIRKRSGKHTHLVIEEVQLINEGNAIVDLAVKAATAMRSNNLMLTVIMNAVSRLQRLDLAGFVSNITTVIAGYMKAKDIDTLIDITDTEEIKADLIAIKNERKKHKYAFAISYNTGFQKGNTIIKSCLPPDITKKYQTRTVMKT